MISDTELERYSRQLLLPGWDIEGQEALARSSVLVVGCGGIGTPAALYLAGAGVGSLRLVDDDTVELSNLPRQLLFTEADIGRPKASVVAEKLAQRNTLIDVVAEVQRFDEHSAEALLAGVDVVVDASDNRDTRMFIDHTTALLGLPWMMAAAVQFAGQNIAFAPDRSGGCYHCLAPEEPGTAGPGQCRDLGIAGPVVGQVALAQALDVLKYLTGFAPVPWGQLRLRDYRHDEQHRLTLQQRPGCPVCGGAQDR